MNLNVDCQKYPSIFSFEKLGISLNANVDTELLNTIQFLNGLCVLEKSLQS